MGGQDTAAPEVVGAGTVAGVGARVLVLDNYDSFVYNLVQYLGELGAEPLVHRSDALDLGDVAALDPDAVLISPGPGRPEDAGISNDVIRELGCPSSACASATSASARSTAGRWCGPTG
jgi:carbamoylphosphate synthase small subunit